MPPLRHELARAIRDAARSPEAAAWQVCLRVAARLPPDARSALFSDDPEVADALARGEAPEALRPYAPPCVARQSAARAEDRRRRRDAGPRPRDLIAPCLLAVALLAGACSDGPRALAEPQGPVFRLNPQKWQEAGHGQGR